MRLNLAAACVSGLFLVLGVRTDAQTKPDLSVVGKVAVTAKGTVSFDGAAVTLDELKPKLDDVKKRNGVIWYYREAGDKEPPPQATEVIKLLIERRLPVSLSTKPDYSDVLLPDGTTKPRSGVPQP